MPLQPQKSRKPCALAVALGVNPDTASSAPGSTSRAPTPHEERHWVLTGPGIPPFPMWGTRAQADEEAINAAKLYHPHAVEIWLDGEFIASWRYKETQDA